MEDAGCDVMPAARKPSYVSKAPPPLTLSLDHNDNIDNIEPGDLAPSDSMSSLAIDDPDVTRVQFDRRELEALVEGDGDKAQSFFGDIMRQSGATIVWPSKLQMCNKSKKDPFIRITGPYEQRADAKCLILAKLQQNHTRVDLKIDVPFTEHSHIIGKQGRNTQAVMQATKCLVHFPDSNKVDDNEKSNSVTLSGQLDSVELARRAIRRLEPLTVTFSLDQHQLRQHVDARQLMRDANYLPARLGYRTLTISIRQPKSTHRAPFCLIRGAVAEEDTVRECIHKFQQEYFVPFANVKYQMCMDILPAQQIDVKGVNNRLLAMIAQATSASIKAPPDEDVLRKGATTFVIGGELNAVFQARRHIIALLPANLQFSLCTEQAINTQLLEARFACRLNIRTRPTNDMIQVVSATVSECHVEKLYRLRQLLTTGSEIGAPSVDDYQFITPSMRSQIDEAHVEIRSMPSRQMMKLPYAPVPFIAMTAQNGHPLLQDLFNVAPIPFSANMQQILQQQPYATGLGVEQTRPTRSLSQTRSSRTSSSKSPCALQPPGVRVNDAQRLRQAVEVAAVSVATSETSHRNGFDAPDGQGEKNMSEYNRLRLLAIDKMAQPGTGCRAPTDDFAGYGFSLSTPHNVLRSALRHRSDATFDVTEEEEDEGACTVPPCTPIQTKAPPIPCVTTQNYNRTAVSARTSLRDNIVPEHSEVHHRRLAGLSASPRRTTQAHRFASSSAMETMRPLLARTTEDPVTNGDMDLRHLLAIFKLEHLYQVLEENEVDLDALSCMDENDFTALGLSIGAKAKLRHVQLYLAGENRFSPAQRF